jgi:hypothetical protein
MKWRWDTRPPEFVALPKKDRARIWHKVYFRSLRRPRMFLPLLGLVIMHMAVMILMTTILPSRNAGWGVAMRMLASGVTMAILVLIFARYAMRVLREELLVYVSNFCLNCWYDLTGNESGICPECGTPRRPETAVGT